MLKSYRYRLYPTETQKVLLDKHFGSCRFVYNLALETKNNAYATHKKDIDCYTLINQLPDLKQECEWLKEVDSQALQQSIINLDKAFTQFFKGYTKFPNFKKKSNKLSFCNPQGLLTQLKEDKLYQPKFREGIKVTIDRQFTGKIKNTTISKSPTGKYFVSILVENNIDLPTKAKIIEETAIGIDLGIKSFIVTSDGLKVDNPKYLKQSLEHLKYLQRQASKKIKGSSNKRKANLKVALQHERITNQRKDFLHKLSTQLIKNHDTLCLENLNINGMLQNHCLAQSIQDAGWSMFVEQCKYKADWYGKNILQIPTFEPSTKMCSVCGYINNDLTLNDRDWACPCCGKHHDRDENAAKVIKSYCLNSIFKNKTAAGYVVEKSVELPTLVGAVKQKLLTNC